MSSERLYLLPDPQTESAGDLVGPANILHSSRHPASATSLEQVVRDIVEAWLSNFDSLTIADTWQNQPGHGFRAYVHEGWPELGEPTEVDISCTIHGAPQMEDGVCWVSYHQNARTPCEFSGRLAFLFDSQRMT